MPYATWLGHLCVEMWRYWDRGCEQSLIYHICCVNNIFYVAESEKGWRGLWFIMYCGFFKNFLASMWFSLFGKVLLKSPNCLIDTHMVIGVKMKYVFNWQGLVGWLIEYECTKGPKVISFTQIWVSRRIAVPRQDREKIEIISALSSLTLQMNLRCNS